MRVFKLVHSVDNTQLQQCVKQPTSEFKEKKNFFHQKTRKFFLSFLFQYLIIKFFLSFIYDLISHQQRDIRYNPDIYLYRSDN